GARLLERARAVSHECVREFPHGRGRRASEAGLRRREVRPPQAAEADVRPHELLPPQPEHQARLKKPTRCASDPPMRIMMLTPLYLPWVGGLEIFSSQLIAELRARGHDAIVVTSHAGFASDTTDEIDGVTVHRLGLHEAVAARDAREIFRLQSVVAGVTNSF